MGEKLNIEHDEEQQNEIVFTTSIIVFLTTPIILSMSIFIFMPADITSESGKEIFYKLLIPIAILTAALFRVLYLKGEKPKWQWGIPKRDSTKDKR